MALPLFRLKSYQTNALACLRTYLAKAVELSDADRAFHAVTKGVFLPPPGLPGLPYVCLRVPTGGGKTILAAHSIAVAADSFLRIENPTVLWLVPSDAIREQTLATLSDRAHPNRRAIADRFGENVRILTVQDALYARRADFDGGAVIIVATLQAFRVEKTEGRKVYEANGELMDHFSGLARGQLHALEAGPSGEPVPSLANVLRMRRPMVIVDEAHNARTELSFDTLARLSPSLIIEFTATPVLPREHRPEKGIYASNVLHSVSAAELKVEEMIKLPVILRGRSDPRETISDAIAWLDELSAIAQQEEKLGGDFVRPVMLIQAEPRFKDKPTLHPDYVKRMLIEDFRIPQEHVAIATGESRGLEGVDLFARDCAIRFIITQQALKEGWDCSFAYVLCSVAEQKSARAVEQLLGRVLRLPHARWKRQEDLNRAYAFATTTSFQQAANTLKDGLVANGFEKTEAEFLIRPSANPLPGLEQGGQGVLQEEALPFDFDYQAHTDNVRLLTAGRVELDPLRQVMRAKGALSDYDRKALMLAMPEATQAITALVHKSRGARLGADKEAQKAIKFAIPRLGVKTTQGFQLFDRGHFLDIPWRIENEDADAIRNHFIPPRLAMDEAHVDITSQGQVNLLFVNALHEQLSLNLQEHGWNKNALINWLDRRLPVAARRDITRVSSTLFITKALDSITAETGMSIDALARAKFRLVEALVRVIDHHRENRQYHAFQHALLPQSGLDFRTSAELELVLDEARYGYRQPYEGNVEFQKHLFRVIGDLQESGEEHDCAVHLDRMPDVIAWVRNTSQQPHSFWLQTSTDKFYPDFIALLKDGRYLVLEYKGAPYITNDDSREKRLIGELWAERSMGTCLFVMADKRSLGLIDAAIRSNQ